MADFNTSKTALNEARDRTAKAEADLFAARQQRGKLQAQRAQLARTRGEGLARLDAALARAQEAEVLLSAEVRDRRRIAGRLAGEFATVADPRKEIGRWRDETPILLLPLRLEARFKTFTDQSATREELWVRIYPDDCNIDTFEPALSEIEIDSGRRFWIETWAAGGIEAQRRAAWRNLVAGHGGGRAAWIVREYAPAVAPLAKPGPDDIVLVIAADAPPSPAEQTALSVYWKAAWLAMDDAAALDAALQTLAATPGIGNADQLVAQFVPANPAAAPPAPKSRGAVSVQVAWLTLPALAAGKTRSWSAPARARLLPDCFVVQGWQDDRMVFEQTGAPVPDALVAGPDPAAPVTEQMRHDADGELSMPDDMQWMTDFDAAVAVGMGIRIALDPQRVDLARPLQRVLALGVRLADNAAQGQARLEELLNHHRYGRAGFGLLPQGAPTNNMEEEGAAYSRYDNADALFDSVFGAAATLDPARDWWLRQDGQWLADALGVGSAAFDRLPNAAAMDIAEARAINRALWPGTFGYVMQTMLHPIFDDEEIETTRWFYTHFVTGRGMLPALRIGNQPYGVLPVSALSQAKWLYGERLIPVGGLAMPPGFYNFRGRFAALLTNMRQDWETFAQAVSHIAAPGDAHQVLLDVIGLHPASVEFHQRYAESLDHLFNVAKLQGFAAQILESIRRRQLQEPALTLLRRLGYAGEMEPEALSKFFTSRTNRLNGPLIDDRPLSETDLVRDYTADNRNYLEWLADAARTSFEDLRQERGFLNDQPPNTMLYIMLHHALLLGYWDSSLRLFLAANVMTPTTVKTARQEQPFLHVSGGTAESESRFASLYSQDARVAGAAGTVAEKVRLSLTQLPTQGLADQLAALDLMKGIPTARLERCLAEHIDTASFRLDSWLLGMVNYQLAALRYPVPAQGQPVAAHQGIYLGAYGWLENLQRKTAAFQPVTLAGELAAAFPADPAAPLMRDPGNGGFVLAPSVNHATTAAILRAGYLANASAAQPDALSVNLSSARVRVALGLIEGIRNGQPLGALLGYRLQRGLHDGHPALELDRFVAPLRKQFPLVADQLASTLSPEGVPIEAIEANNVIDGLKLIERIRTSGQRAYPFGLAAALPAVASSDEQNAIDFEVNALLDANDAIADLALAEGVHQAVLGNFDRVASTLDAYAKGTFPPEPEVARTPRGGLGLTHRVGLHFESGVDPDVSPVLGVSVSPRSRAQAMVNKWLATMLPASDQVGVQVQWTDPSTAAPQNDVITQKALDLQPIDLLYLVTLDADTALSELDDRVLRELQARHAPRPDSAIAIQHTVRLAAPMISFFELAPLIRHLRSLLLRSRPLAPTDLALAGEASRAHDFNQSIDRARVQKSWDALDALRQDVAAAVIAAPVDAALADTVALFERAAKFGLQQVGWGFAYEWRRRTYADLLGRVAAVVARWDDRLANFDADLVQYDVLPAATDEERYTALGRLDLLVAANPISPREPTPLAYRNALPARRTAFAARRTVLAALTAAPDPALAQLLADIQGLPPIADFDLRPIVWDDVTDAIALFVADLQKRVTNLKIEVQRRLDAAAAQLQAHDVSADPAVRLRALQEAGSALLGSDMKLVGEFTLRVEAAAELNAALTASSSGALTQYLRVSAKRAFPVEDWLHGVARVREKIHAWEQAGILAATLGRSELELTPAQLPYLSGEGWLAMEFDPAIAIEGERLLYTAHYMAAPDPAAAMCGLLIDEWTEVVPARDETIGLSFHCDRPGSEPPQCWLLVTPAQMSGEWQWSDLVGALRETLDLARLRAVEPAQIDATAYARFLPATTSAATLYGISIGMNLSRVNQFTQHISGDRDG